MMARPESHSLAESRRRRGICCSIRDQPMFVTLRQALADSDLERLISEYKAEGLPDGDADTLTPRPSPDPAFR